MEWRDEYFAVSASGPVLDKARECIKNQKEHHSKQTFQKEDDEFIENMDLRNSMIHILAKANNWNGLFYPPSKDGGN